MDQNFSKKIKFHLYGSIISKDKVRIELKKTFSNNLSNSLTFYQYNLISVDCKPPKAYFPLPYSAGYASPSSIPTNPLLTNSS